MLEIVDRMVNDGNFAGTSTVPFLGSEWDWNDIAALQRAGAMQVTSNEFLETELALRYEGITWDPIAKLSSPVPLCRVSRIAKDPLKCSKLELLVVLVGQGWRSGKPAEASLKPASPLVCELTVKKSLSYLACMAHRCMIWTKGITEISHTQCDHYYKCLLKLSAEDLAKILAMLGEPKDDAWFRATYKKRKPKKEDEASSSDDGSGEGGPPRPPRIRDGGLLPLPAPAAVLDPSFVPWKRQIVSIGEDSEALKVYFDNMSHKSGQQQAWLTCRAHDDGCIRWRRVSGDSKKFFAAMYAWHRAARLNADLRSRDEHMPFEPSDAQISECEAALVLQDF